MIFYCYNRCSTCRKAEKFLKDKGVNLEVRDIVHHDLSKEDIKNLHIKSGLPLKRLFNTSGNLYKELNLKEQLSTMTDDEAYALLSQHGMLIKRPILITEDDVIFGFDEAKYEALVNA